MRLLKLYFFAAVWLLLFSGGLYTTSFFSDFEGSDFNTFAATDLDQAVAGQPIDGLLCTTVDEVSTILYTSNLGSLDFSYGFVAENATGTLCAGLTAKLTTSSSTLYDGPLTTLIASDLVLPVAADAELQLTLRLTPGATESGTCQFTTAWQAGQLSATAAGGFSDNETITHFVTGSASGNGAGCVPPDDTVYLHLSKAISGDDQGFALSDFSYRVTGNGIDIIVPHDHTVALPVGTYTIEEIVPENFVKEDWRIGWYGECERGSTFVTTITIDEGNIDHDTLYCQADNQYRPDQRRQASSQMRMEGGNSRTRTASSTETTETNGPEIINEPAAATTEPLEENSNEPAVAAESEVPAEANVPAEVTEPTESEVSGG